jgi:hypothetical protein
VKDRDEGSETKWHGVMNAGREPVMKNEVTKLEIMRQSMSFLASWIHANLAVACWPVDGAAYWALRVHIGPKLKYYKVKKRNQGGAFAPITGNMPSPLS